jgi:hypothetical protein
MIEDMFRMIWFVFIMPDAMRVFCLACGETAAVLTSIFLFTTFVFDIMYIYIYAAIDIFISFCCFRDILLVVALLKL